MTRPDVRLFLSYSSNDAEIVSEFRTLLDPRLRIRSAFCGEIWIDVEIGCGAAWRAEIDKALEACDVGLIAVSPDLLLSDFVMDYEAPKLIQNEKLIKPVLLTYVDVNKVQMGALSGLNVYGYRDKQAFDGLGQADRKTWVNGLVADIERDLAQQAVYLQ